MYCSSTSYDPNRKLSFECRSVHDISFPCLFTALKILYICFFCNSVQPASPRNCTSNISDQPCRNFTCWKLLVCGSPELRLGLRSSDHWNNSIGLKLKAKLAYFCDTSFGRCVMIIVTISSNGDLQQCFVHRFIYRRWFWVWDRVLLNVRVSIRIWGLWLQQSSRTSYSKWVASIVYSILSTILSPD